MTLLRTERESPLKFPIRLLLCRLFIFTQRTLTLLTHYFLIYFPHQEIGVKSEVYFWQLNRSAQYTLLCAYSLNK